MNSINPNIFPKGGFYFIESDGTKIVGQTWTGVVARARNYRRRAGLPEGDVEQEVINQACIRNPELCRYDNGERQAQTNRSSLKTRVLKWLAALREKGPVDFVPETDARNRAAVCAACHLNTEIGGGCNSCKQALAESRKELLGRRPRDARVQACAGTSEDAQVALWIEQPAINNPALPAHCWRKRTI